MNTNALSEHQPRSYLFTVRLWVEELGEGGHEVRMQVKHVLSGEIRYFRQWAELELFLLAKVERPSSNDERKITC